MRKELSGSLAFDTSTLLELVYGTEKGVKLKDAIKSEKIYCNISELTFTELKYVLCRKIGEDSARDRVKNLIASGYIILHEDTKLVDYAAAYKCERRISIADCFTLALAKKIGAPAIFAKKEGELIEEMAKKPFDVKIIFLEDLF